MTHEHDDDTESSVSSFRRIWKRRNGAADGSSELVLAAMAVLYDAGEPLTREQIVERLRPRLDVYAQNYLQAWYARRTQQWRQANQRRYPHRTYNVEPPTTTLSLETILSKWVTQVFALRVRNTNSLICHPDGRFEPGEKAPIVQTIDGRRLRYTPETRRELEQIDQQQSRLHLVQLEFKRAAATLSDQSAAARAEALRFLLRRLYPRDAAPNVSRSLGHTFAHLLHVADTPESQAALIRLATEWLLS